jgi:diadenylate cyclase
MPAAPMSPALHDALTRVAPGTALRDGLDRIVRGKTGALLVLGDGPDVLAICSGGFLLDAPFSPQRLSELAKMDGAIILGSKGQRLARANVHLLPDPSVPTSETGTRHRTAERIARSIPIPVIAVSEEMGVISVYVDGIKHQLQDVSRLLDRANQAVQTLERYRTRLDDALDTLTALEVEDVVTIRDVVTVLQRRDMVRRIANEIDTTIVELGVDARLLRLQIEEYSGADHEVDLVQDEATDLDLEAPVAPRGLRLLSHVPRMTPALAAAVADHFGVFTKLQRATVAELAEVPGVDPALAVVVKDTLERITENSILDRFD